MARIVSAKTSTWRFGRTCRAAAWLVAVLATTLGCTYRGPTANFLEQRLTFISYMNGDDIRAACEAGVADRYRFVFVADFERQARSYDVVPRPPGALLRQQVDRGLSVSGIRLDRLFQAGAPARAEVPLGAEAVAELEDAMFASGVFRPPPVGLRLESEGFFWIVTGCYRGDYFLTGYRYPSDRWDDIRFDAFLFARDRLDAPIRRPPERLPDTPIGGCSQQTREGSPCFSVEIGEDGLLGAWTID